MERESLLDMIRRLLAFSSSPNEHEARLAMSKAQELLLKHGLSMAEIGASKAGQFAEEIAFRGPRWPLEHAYVASIVQEFWFVHCVDRLVGKPAYRREAIFFGAPQHLPVAIHVYVYLTRLFRRLWREYRSAREECQRVPGAYARTYFLGLALGVSDRLKQGRQSFQAAGDGRSLMVIQAALDDAFQRRYPGLPVRPSRSVAPSADVFCDGLEKGRSIQIHTTVPGPKQKTLAFG